MKLGWLICILPKKLGGGHKRGKKIDGPRETMINGVLQTIIVYKCPRCSDTWTRKVKREAK